MKLQALHIKSLAPRNGTSDSGSGNFSGNRALEWAHLTFLQSRSDLLMVAVGFSPRNADDSTIRRGATVETTSWRDFSRRSATDGSLTSVPWDKSHGYHHSSLREENSAPPCNKVRCAPLECAAFTLLEVMIASGILFICLFAILGLLSNTLRNVKALQRAPVDAGMLAAELSLTNKLSEGSIPGDFGDNYRDYHWKREIFQAETNGLFAVDFVVYRHGNEHSPESHMTILLFRPDSPKKP